MLFSCPSFSFSTRVNGLLQSLQLKHSVFVSTTCLAKCSFVDTHRAVISSGQPKYTGLRIPVPSRLFFQCGMPFFATMRTVTFVNFFNLVGLSVKLTRLFWCLIFEPTVAH